jgi:hypothetical protein
MLVNRKMGQAQKYRDEADDGTKGGAGGGAGGIDLNSPEIQKAIQAKVDESVLGLKNKNAEVIGKLKEAQEKMKQFEGVDFEKLKNLQIQMDNNEEMRLLAEGKTEEVVTRRVELLKRDYESQITARDGKLSEYEQVLKQKEENLRKLLVDGTIREAYIQLDFEPAALEDVTRSARDVFIMDENGNVVPRDANGNMIFSKDGTTPINAAQWLELQAERKTYLRRASKGGGAGTNRGSYGVDKSKMTSTQKIAQGLRDQGLGV